jgi:acetyltransferase
LGVENLSRIFNPKHIAVIGASERAESFGARILSNLAGTYAGSVYPVNPFRQTVQGIPAYSTIERVPAKVDLAIIATPAHTVPQLIEECGKAHVAGVIITSAGFRETGKDGELLELQILQHKKTYGMRILGPSSFGVIRPRMNLYATFSEQKAPPGKTAVISQSAALCSSALDWASETQVGLSAVVSTGSMLDVDLGDLIDFFGVDPQTRNMVLYVESLKDPRKFMSAARGFARTKPIVVVKAGRYQETTLPMLSHIGRLSGQDAVHDAAFRRVGVVRVETVTDLFNCAEALTAQPRPLGTNPTIVTNAGGPGILAADKLLALEGKLPPLTHDSIQALERVLPSFCSFANPLDLFEDAPPDRFKSALEICLRDPNSSGVIAIFTPQGASDPVDFANVILAVSKQTRKPILVALTGENNGCREARIVLHKGGIPAFRTPEEAVLTFMYMWRYTQNLELLYQTPKDYPADLSVPVFLKNILRRAYCEGRQILTLPESLQFLNAYNIPVAETLVAKTPAEASALATKLGFPTVMKVLSYQFTHKSEVKGVILNVCSPSQVEACFNELEQKTKNSHVIADFQGVALQRIVHGRRHEILVGSKKDPQFGSLILFGAGGTSAEILKDTSIGFPPLNHILARRLMENTSLFKHSQSSNYHLNSLLLEEILVRFSQLIMDFPEIAEMDINPLLVDESEVVAVDARIVVDRSRLMREGAEHHEHLVIAPYPKQFVSSRYLNNGTEVMLRPIKPEDENRFNELFKSLSAETMRFRFFEIIKEMSHDTLTRYCNLDYDREIAIVAELPNPDKKIIGAVRLILDPDGENGEFAILVGDPWQGLGLGSKLMDFLIEVAKQMRVRRIYSCILPNNHNMLQLCRKKGFKVKILDEETAEASLILG